MDYQKCMDVMLFHILILWMDWKVPGNLNFLFRVLTATIGQTIILLKHLWKG